jgi:hypothetical protein
VELRGLEPLTFSLLARGNGPLGRLQPLQATLSVTESAPARLLGVHMGAPFPPR